MTDTPELRLVTAQGSPYQVGHALGLAGRAAAHSVLLHASYWAAVTAPEHAATVTRLDHALQTRFPAIRAELIGLADGLNLPFFQVLAWNCRGDLLSNTGDGCTSIQIPETPILLAHNEDGLPEFRGSAFLAQVQPDGAPGFTAFCYPGSLPGHTFAATRAGLVQTVNNLRLTGVASEIPRMVLGRAVLGCSTLDAALAVLQDDPRCGGFHMSLAQCGDARVMSVEYGAGRASLRQITQPACHANHALHLDMPQVITDSSHQRQTKCTKRLGRDPRAILRDAQGPGLPIFRTAPDDPDDENTLSTAIFQIWTDHVALEVIDQAGKSQHLHIPCDWSP